MNIKYTREKFIKITDVNAFSSNAKEMSRALNIFADYLLGKSLSSRISMRVHFTKLGSNAMVCWENENYKPREFIMEVDLYNTGTWKNLITTLAHEMVHVKQFARNEIFQNMRKPSDVLMWRNKEIHFKQMYEKDRPWEIEAYAREDEIAKLYWDQPCQT